MIKMHVNKAFTTVIIGNYIIAPHKENWGVWQDQDNYRDYEPLEIFITIDRGVAWSKEQS